MHRSQNKKNMATRLDGAKILVTGGTGSFGQRFIGRLLNNYEPERIIVFSRDEMKQWNMSNEINSDRVSFILGDVRDAKRVDQVMAGVDYVVHAAATKIVPFAESNPHECIKTNVNGAVNIISSAIKHDVDRVVALSTDKACNPVNLYGATKLASDKLFIAANFSQENRSINTRFSVVRYGNVLCSRGSVIPFFRSCIKNGVIPITDISMTRFLISLDQAVDLVLLAFDDMKGGELYVRKVPSMNILEIAQVVAPNIPQNIIGIRPGEKIHEQMISQEDSFYTYEYNEYFKILSSLMSEQQLKESSMNGKIVDSLFEYKSNTNSEWLSHAELKEILNSQYNYDL